MDRWALKYKDQCSFVCVGCAGSDLAEAFASELKLRHCHNVWVDEDSMPSWGQLGCSGFIVCDQRHSVVCKSTSAFMEVRQLAFKHVDTLVEAMLVGSSSAAAIGTQPYPGLLVELHSLTKAELNGTQAIVLEAASAATGERTVVQTRDGRKLKIKPTNLRPMNAEAAEDGCGEGGCGEGGCDKGGCGTGGCGTGGCGEVGGGERMPSRMQAAMARVQQKEEEMACDMGS